MNSNNQRKMMKLRVFLVVIAIVAFSIIYLLTKTGVFNQKTQLLLNAIVLIALAFTQVWITVQKK